MLESVWHGFCVTKRMDAGFQRDGLIQVSNLGFRGVSQDQSRALVERIRRIPGVQAAARTQIGVSPNGNSMTDFFLPGATNSISLGVYGVETGFFESMGMRLLAGRFFSDSQGKDDATTPYPVEIAAERALAARGINVVITESAAKRLGFHTPQSALGKELRGALTVPEVGLIPCTIVGVVADTRFRSVREPIQPTVYVMAPDDVFRIDGRGRTTQLTNVNGALLAELDPVTLDKFSFTGANNDRVWGMVR